MTEIKQIAKRIWLMWGFRNLYLLAAGVAFFSFGVLSFESLLVGIEASLSRREGFVECSANDDR